MGVAGVLGFSFPHPILIHGCISTPSARSFLTSKHPPTPNHPCITTHTQCDVWAQASSVHRHPPFVTYYCDVETQEPVRWVFFDGGSFDVQQWIPGGTLPDDQWQLPTYCFTDDEAEAEPVAVALATD